MLKKLCFKNKLPQFALIVHVEEAFMHCSKCMIRSKLWTDIDPDIRQKVPSLAEIIIDHAQLEAPLEQVKTYLEESAKNSLY